MAGLDGQSKSQSAAELRQNEPKKGLRKPSPGIQGQVALSPSTKALIKHNDPANRSNPPNQTGEWRKTDQIFHQMVEEDKRNFAAGHGRRLLPSPNNPGPSIIGVIEFIEEPVIPIDLLVIVETQSMPNLMGVVPVHHRPFDPSVLPEEPPVDYSKYMQCPHCGRRFETCAAIRHIPQCQEYYFNMAEKENFKRAGCKKC